MSKIQGNNRMKIAFVTNLPSHYLNKLFEEIANHYQIKFLFFSDASENWIEKRNPLVIGNYDGLFVRGIKLVRHIRINPRLIWKLLTGNYDIFIQYINGSIEILTTYTIARLLKKPFILWTDLSFHPDTIFHKLSFPFVKHIYSNSDAIVVWGTHVSSYLKSLGINEKKIFFSCGAVDNSLFSKGTSEECLIKLAKKYDLCGKKIILYVGRLSIEKGLNYLLDAYKEIEPSSNTALVIIGEGEQKQFLTNYVKSNNLTNVHFLGYVPNEELDKYYALADILVLPSIETKTAREAWGLVINEAMNQGCSIITTDIVGAAISGMVIDGENGLIVKEKNVRALKEAIYSLVIDPEKLSKMKEHSLNKIKDWNYEKAFKGFSNAINYVSKK
jgi:glycosyltransferase involved in cell wall biosynthesis